MSDEGRMQANRTTPADAVELSDAPAGKIALALAGLIGALLLMCAGVAGLLLLFDRHPPLDAGPTTSALIPPEPRLQVDEPAQRHRIEVLARARLAPATNRIGIERSMQRITETGWPDEPGPDR